MRPELLNETEIGDYLKKYPFWNIDGNKIIREIVMNNFVSIVGLVNSIAIFSEKLNHHPDLLIYGWNKLRVSITTNDRGGLTELDFQLADKIESLLN